ncbi:tRNA-specific adenosine deaminase [Luteimicrobium album]|uniref:tRNA-specific adenosine deaminase n=2 Tax=Luteimicrobium album TaxID=1054550 RepID=A0ABQ6I3I1_9MICO|nr:tRNA-specific adenosine deaminase [Luteimicrobium album]
MTVVMNAETAVGLAIELAEEGLAAGEMPIGAVVIGDGQVLGRAHTAEQRLGRRIVHADLLALLQADEALGFSRVRDDLTLAVNLEPCLMCLGAAVTLGISRVWYALESPNDGGIELVSSWTPPVEQPFFAKPAELRGGILRHRSQELFARYADGAGPRGMREWARGLADLP